MESNNSIIPSSSLGPSNNYRMCFRLREEQQQDRSGGGSKTVAVEDEAAPNMALMVKKGVPPGTLMEEKRVSLVDFIYISSF